MYFIVYSSPGILRHSLFACLFHCSFFTTHSLLVCFIVHSSPLTLYSFVSLFILHHSLSTYLFYCSFFTTHSLLICVIVHSSPLTLYSFVSLFILRHSLFTRLLGCWAIICLFVHSLLSFVSVFILCPRASLFIHSLLIFLSLLIHGFGKLMSFSTCTLFSYSLFIHSLFICVFAHAVFPAAFLHILSSSAEIVRAFSPPS